MKHNICIRVGRPDAQPQSLLRCKRFYFPEKLLFLIFGEFSEILVIKPGNTVEGIEIHELQTGGANEI